MGAERNVNFHNTSGATIYIYWVDDAPEAVDEEELLAPCEHGHVAKFGMMEPSLLRVRLGADGRTQGRLLRVHEVVPGSPDDVYITENDVRGNQFGAKKTSSPPRLQRGGRAQRVARCRRSGAPPPGR